MKKKYKKLILYFILIAIAIVLAFVLFKPKSDTGLSKKKDLKKVDAVVIHPSLLIDEISVNGSIQAFDEVELKNEVAGRIVKLNLPEGKSVKKGTVLVKLFDDDLQASLKKSQSQLALQEKIFKRQSELLKVNGISQNDYDQTALQINTIKADIEVQKALIRKTEVVAPFDGVIGLRAVSLGAVVTTSTLLATIRTDNKLKIDFYVPERYGAMIRVGLPVDFSLFSSEKIYNATVIATEQGITNETRNLKVRAMIEKPAKELIAGSFATVKLKLGENPNALLVPTQALIPDQNEKSIIVARNGKAHFVKIKTGIRQSDKIEVTQGLQPGDTVITTGVLFLKENSKLLYSSVK